MPAAIFNGTKIKLLKDRLVGFSDKDLIISGTANPTTSAVDATKGSLYLNSSTGDVFRKSDDGSTTNWEDISGIVGNLNIVSQNKFDLNINGVSSSTGLSEELDTTNPISGIGSLKLTQDAANRLNSYWIIDSFTRTADAPIAMMKTSFEAITGAGVLDEDYLPVAYDVTNSVEIPILPEGLLAGEGFYNGSWQTPAGALSFQIRLKVNHARSAAIQTVTIDNLQTEKYAPTVGSVYHYMGQETLTVSDTTNVSSRLVDLWRNGDSLIMDYRVAWSGAGAGANFEIRVPSYLSIDTSKMPIATNKPIAAALWNDSSTGNVALISMVENSSDIRFRVTGTGSSFNGSQAASGDFIGGRVEVPIVGWSTQAILGEDVGQRAVRARVNTVDSTAIVTGTPYYLGFQSLDFDDNAGFTNLGVVNTTVLANATRYKAESTGVYRYDIQVVSFDADLDAGETTRLRLYKEAAIYHANANQTSATGTTVGRTWTLSGLVELQKGEYLTAGFYHEAGGVISLNTSSTFGFFSVEKTVAPQQIAAGEKVYARATIASTQSATTGNRISFDGIQYDSHNAIGNLGATTWTFTAPRSGKYSVKASAWTDNVIPTTATQSFVLNLYVAGSFYAASAGDYAKQTTASLPFTSKLDTDVPLLKGETIYIQMTYNSTATNLLTGGSDDKYTYIAINSID